MLHIPVTSYDDLKHVRTLEKYNLNIYSAMHKTSSVSMILENISCGEFLAVCRDETDCKAKIFRTVF